MAGVVFRSPTTASQPWSTPPHFLTCSPQITPRRRQFTHSRPPHCAITTSHLTSGTASDSASDASMHNSGEGRGLKKAVENLSFSSHGNQSQSRPQALRGRRPFFFSCKAAFGNPARQNPLHRSKGLGPSRPFGLAVRGVLS